MDVVRGYNLTKFMAFVPKIRKNTKEWRVINVALNANTKHNTTYIAKKLKEYFQGCDGIIFICNNKEILVVARTGENASGSDLSKKIHKKMPEYSCDVHAEDITADGILQIQIHLQELEEKKDSQIDTLSLQNMRKDRKERIIMVVDDDMFTRSLIVKTFQPKGKVLEFEDTQGIVETYLEELPDIVFLDIHMPGGSGIDVLDEILSFDNTAYVIILSADSIKNNVLSAQKYGAHGFITKPFTQEKLMASYNKCPSVEN